MAINIRFGTTFDNKGLNRAKRELATLSDSVSSLGRNFAIAGAAFAGIGAGLASSVKVASDLQESVNAVNVAFGNSAAGILEFGKTAATSLGVSQVAFNNAAVRFSAFAERIVGEGGDVAGFIGDISTRAADFASVFNIEVAEALGVFQSGLSGEAEPLKRFGVNLLQTEVNAYAARNGIGALGRELTETEKVQARYGLLMEATNKTAGDFANTSDGLANGMRILRAQVTDTQGEIGNALLPILAEILPIVRELVTQFGQKLVTAVQGVNWQELIATIVNLATAFVENIEVIVRVTVAIFALNTIIKTATVLMNLAAVAGKLYAFAMGQLAAGASIATVATTLLGNALRLIPFVAIISAIGLVVNGVMNLGNEASKSTTLVVGLDGAIKNAGNSAERSVGQFEATANGIKRINDEIIKSTFTAAQTSAAYDRAETRRFENMAAASRAAASRMGRPIIPGMPDLSSLLSGTGASQAAAEAERVAREAAIEAERVAREAADALAEIERQAQAERDRAAAAEQARLDERLRGYKSFADSVKSLFGSIKESILSSFDLPKLGNSVNSITRNIAKLLERTKNFANNITQLSGLGLNSALLQQVIQAGPMAGSQLAQAIVGGGSAFVGQLNQAYGEFGNLASGIAGVGTRSAFANQEVVNNYYQIEVSGGVGSGPTIGKAIVDAIKSYERTSGAVWQGA
jgi:hypothetical protein